MGDGLGQKVIGTLVATLSTALGVVSMGDVLRCRRNKSLGKVGHASPERAAVVRKVWTCFLTGWCLCVPASLLMRPMAIMVNQFCTEGCVSF